MSAAPSLRIALAVLIHVVTAENMDSALRRCLYNSSLPKHPDELDDKNHPLPIWRQCRNVSCIREVYMANGLADYVPGPADPRSARHSRPGLLAMGLRQNPIEEMECKDGKMPLKLFTATKDVHARGEQARSKINCAPFDSLLSSQRRTPIILRGCAKAFPAHRKWAENEYLRSRTAADEMAREIKPFHCLWDPEVSCTATTLRA